MKYSIDTSAILDGWRRYYPPDTFPGLWRQLETLIARGDLRATEEVLHELEKRDDEVHAWAKSQSDLFVPIDDAVQEAVAQVLAEYPKLIDTRRGRSATDPFVIALAMVSSCAVVTGERPTDNAERPNIPDVCTDFRISCHDLLTLIRAQGWSFS
jgi:hypothetical protein